MELEELKQNWNIMEERLGRLEMEQRQQLNNKVVSKVKQVQERMLREIRMCGNFRAAFFLAEPVFPVALTECGGCPSAADTTLTSKGG